MKHLKILFNPDPASQDIGGPNNPDPKKSSIFFGTNYQ